MNVCDMIQSMFNLCLFIGTKVMSICYSDDLILRTHDKSDFDELSGQIMFVCVSLEQESSVT